MLNLFSLAIGLFALLLAVPAFIPLLGWGYWFIVPIALVGFGIGLVSRHRSGQNLNLAVIVVGVLRLMLGHGIF